MFGAGGKKNFILTADDVIYAYRSTDNGVSHTLYYSNSAAGLAGEFSYMELNHQAVMSSPPTTGAAAAMDWLTFDNYQMVILRNDSPPEIVDNPGQAYFQGGTEVSISGLRGSDSFSTRVKVAERPSVLK